MMLVLMAGLWAQVAAAAPLPPLKDFARLPQYTDVKISPDGSYLAIKVPEEDRTSLAFIHIADMKVTGVLRLGATEHIDRFWWKGGNRVLASLAIQDGYLEIPSRTGELVAMDADGRGYKYLFGYNGSTQAGTHLTGGTKHYGALEMIDPLVDDPKEALVAITSWLDGVEGRTMAERINVHTGDLHMVATSPLPGGQWSSFLADQQGQLRYVSGADQDYQVQTYRRDVETGSWTRLDAASIDGSSVRPIKVSADGKSVFLLRGSGSRPDCLLVQSIETGQVGQSLCDPESDVRRTLLSFDGKDVIGAVFEPGKPKLAYLAAGSADQKTLQALSNAFPGQFVVPVSHSTDGKLSVLYAYSDRNPGDYYLLDRETHHARYLLSEREWIEPAQMSEVLPVQIRARDGVLVHGYLTLPRGRKPENLPLIVNPHGGPFGVHDDWEWDADAQMLASRGYAVLKVNFRGSGGYGDSFQGSAKRKWGTLMIDDITDATRWAVTQGYADPARLCIYGGSYGGYAALMSAVREPDLYRCVIGYAGVYDLELLKHDTDFNNTRLGRTYIEDYIGATKEDRLAQSPIAYLDKLKAALLIVHGKGDTRAPFSQAKALASALDERHHPYETLFKAGEWHGFYKEENRVELYEKMLAFLAKNIGAADAAAPAAP